MNYHPTHPSPAALWGRWNDYCLKFGLTGLIIAVTLLVAADRSAAEGVYAGEDGCKCHKSEIIDWERSKHAKAFDLLLPGKRKAAKTKAGLDPKQDYSRDVRCIKCHVVGYNSEGGFIDIATTPAQAGVGCESCHGPGKSYRIVHGKKPLTFTKEEVKALGQQYSSSSESVCRNCHEHPDSPFQPHIDAKYRFRHKEALKQTDLFHNYYPLKAKH